MLQMESKRLPKLVEIVVSRLNISLPFIELSSSTVKDCNNFTDFIGKEFLDPAIDETVKATNSAWEKGHVLEANKILYIGCLYKNKEGITYKLNLGLYIENKDVYCIYNFASLFF